VTLLRGNAETRDVRLDRVQQFDDRSRLFSVADVTPQVFRSYTWACGPRLDQGSEGACVGFGWAHELAARPTVIKNVTEVDAHSVYVVARTLDDLPGEDYEGTSVLAGAKAVTKLRFLGEYRWAFSFDDFRQALGHHGPVVLGLDWHEGMMDTDALGQVAATGDVVGGHCILALGISTRRKRVLLLNSWGPTWGWNGQALISFDDLEMLLAHDGEACVPVRRLRPSGDPWAEKAIDNVNVAERIAPHVGARGFVDAFA
jgi:hypothetical protein